MSTLNTDHVHAIAAVLESDNPRLLWTFHGDSEYCAELILQAINEHPPSVDPPAVDQAQVQVQGRPFTSDDAAALVTLTVLAPVIGVAVAAANRIRRRRAKQRRRP